MIFASVVITVSFHDFKSQDFKLSVSNPKSKYVAYVSVLSRISNCQGLGRKNKFEIMKTDRSVAIRTSTTSWRSTTSTWARWRTRPLIVNVIIAITRITISVTIIISSSSSSGSSGSSSSTTLLLLLLVFLLSYS